jgi:hypothetical protein
MHFQRCNTSYLGYFTLLHKSKFQIMTENYELGKTYGREPWLVSSTWVTEYRTVVLVHTELWRVQKLAVTVYFYSPRIS